MPNKTPLFTLKIKYCRFNIYFFFEKAVLILNAESSSFTLYVLVCKTEGDRAVSHPLACILIISFIKYTWCGSK